MMLFSRFFTGSYPFRTQTRNIRKIISPNITVTKKTENSLQLDVDPFRPKIIAKFCHSEEKAIEYLTSPERQLNENDRKNAKHED